MPLDTSSHYAPNPSLPDVQFEHQLELHLRGPARLEHHGQPLKVQRKALGLLYYLALEGVSRREQIADLLWSGPSAANCLRVELSKLRSLLRTLGFEAFNKANPMQLPPFIKLVDNHTPGSTPRELLEGLEDLSSDYQLWLESKRAQLGSSSSNQQLREMLLQDISQKITPPYLLFVQGPPGSGRTIFARDLAQKLKLPYIEGTHGNIRALRLINETITLNDDLLSTIISDKGNVWVVKCSSFGEDSTTVLRLREAYPPERTRYLELPPISWLEAQQHFLTHLDFTEAARLYHFSHGNLSFLQELLHIRPEAGFTESIPVPRSIQARYTLEARYLPQEARYTLECLSVHPGILTEGFLQAFDAAVHLDELERRGWLVFKDGWRFVSEPVRHLMYNHLKPGQRQRYHQQAATYFATSDNPFAEAYHQSVIGEPLNTELLYNYTNGWSRQVLTQTLTSTSISSTRPLPPPMQPYYAGEALELIEVRRSEEGLEEGKEHITILRTPTQTKASILEWQLPEEAALVRISGRAHLRNILNVGMQADAVPIKLTFKGSRTFHAYIGGVQQSCSLDDGSPLLPLHTDFDYWFYIPDARYISLNSKAETALIDLHVEAHKLAHKGGLDVEGVSAYVLQEGVPEAIGVLHQT